MAPELLKFHNYVEKVDIWAIGVIAHELLFGEVPFKGVSIDEVLSKYKQRVQSHQYPFNGLVNISREAQDFIKQCLAPDPRRRPAADQLLHHAWIQNMLI